MKPFGRISGISLTHRVLPWLVVCLAVAGSGLLATEPEETWIIRNPLPTSNSLRDVVHGDGLWVAVGAGGTIVVSRDLKVWTPRPTGTTEWLHAIAYGEGRLVAVGARSMIAGVRSTTILVSDDGESWQTGHPPQQSTTLYSIGYGAGRFVAGGWGKLLISDNGLDWTAQDIGISSEVHEVAFIGGKFMALIGGADEDWIMTSEDGLTWTWSNAKIPQPVFSGSLLDIAYGNGVYIIVGYESALRSEDGVTWTEIPGLQSSALYSVTFGGSKFLAVGWEAYEGVALVSANGLEWTRQPIDAGPSAIEYGDGSYAVVGHNGSILTSPDGEHWTWRSPESRADLRSVAANEELVVAVGGKAVAPPGQLTGTILASPDGVQWTERVNGSPGLLNQVVFGGDRWVAVGTSGAVAVSPDGKNWTHQSLGPNAQLNGVAYGAGRFVAVGGQPTAHMWSSEDGIAWTGYAPPVWLIPSPALTGIAYGGEERGFVAVGEGMSYWSSDGLVWHERPGAGGPLQNITYGNGLFASVGWNEIYTSANGSNWTAVAGSFTLQGPIAAVGEGLAVAWDAQGRLALSRFGHEIPWTTRFGPVLPPIGGLCEFRGSLIAVGAYGTIAQSLSDSAPARFRPWELRFLNDGACAFTLDGPPAATLLIESSADLQTWTPINACTNWSGTGEVVDEAATRSGQRFYRATKQ